MSEKFKKNLTFTLMMVFCMATVMLTYNAITTKGFTNEAIVFFLMRWIPTMIIAFAVEFLVVGRNAAKLHAILTSPSDPKIKHTMVMALIFVTSMASIMSFYGTFLSVGFGADFWGEYIVNLARNWPIALLTQLFIAGPLVRFVHGLVYRLPQPTEATQASASSL